MYKDHINLSRSVMLIYSACEFIIGKIGIRSKIRDIATLQFLIYLFRTSYKIKIIYAIIKSEKEIYIFTFIILLLYFFYFQIFLILLFFIFFYLNVNL